MTIPAGVLDTGNIDLTKRPRVKNADGSISTVRSISFEEDGKEILIPTVSPDGKILSNDEAIDLYHKTGQHLGTFKDAASATAYAERVHNAQADALEGRGTGAVPTPVTPIRPGIKPVDEGPFGKLMDEEAGQKQQALTQSAFVAGQRKDPGKWAQAIEIAKRIKTSPQFAYDNLDVLTHQDHQARITQAAKHSFSLQSWLSNPDNATIAKDELPSLSTIDTHARALAPPQPITPDASVVGNMPQRFAPTSDYSTGFQKAVKADDHSRDWQMDVPHAAETGYSDLKAAAGQLAVAYGHMTPEAAAQFVSESNKHAQDLRAAEPAYAKEFAASQEEHRKAIDATVANAPEFKQGKILFALKEYAKGNIKTVGDLLGMVGSAIRQPAGFGYSIAESTPQMLPALAGGFAGGASGGALGAVGGTFIGMGPVNVGSEINAELARRGYDITKASDLLRAYSDPALMAEVRGKAARAGVTSAAVSSLVAGYAGRFAEMAKESSAVTRAAATGADVATQAGGQGVAQLAGQIAGEKGDLKKVSLGAAAETAVSMLGYGIGETAIGMSRRGFFHEDPVKAATEATGHASEATRTIGDIQSLAEIGAAIKEAPTTASLPDRVKQLVETASGGEDASTVYFQEGQWDEYWQSKGESPALKAAEIMGDDGKAYTESKSTGAPLAIPLGDYVSKVGPTDHFEGLLEVARTRPDGMSLGEAQDYLEALPATMNELAKEAEAAPVQKYTPVRDRIESQLLKAGRTPAEAKAAAQVYEAAFTQLGKRSGINPSVLFNEYQLRIQGVESPLVAPPVEPGVPPEGITERRSLSERNTAAREAFDEVAGQIRAFPQERRQALRDALAAQPDMLDLHQPAYHGSPHIFDEFSLQKIGTGEGAQSYGWGLYFTGKKEVAEYYRTVLSAWHEPGFAALEDGGSAIPLHAKEKILKEGAPALLDRLRHKRNELKVDESDLAHVQKELANPNLAEIRMQMLITANLFAGQVSRDLGEIAQLEQIQASGNYNAFQPGRTYKVDIPHDETMLQWDKPLSEQSDHVAAALERVHPDYKFENVHYDDAEHGSAIYSRLADTLGGPEVASRALAEAGIAGIKYLDQGSRADGEGSHNYVVFDDKLVKILEYQQGERGRFRLNPRTHQAVIDLFATADRSTFLHESGHLYLEVLGDLATAEKASPDISKDYASVLDWLGVENRSQIGKDQHEQFARGFEAYLMEGKAPTPALRDAFYRFKRWLVKLYKTTGALNVNLSPEIRQVFDRMLATDEEIKTATESEHTSPLFDDPRSVGLSEDEAARYSQVVTQANQAAEEEITTRIMKEVRREESKDWKILKETVKSAVEAEAEKDPVMRALSLLQRGKTPKGDPLPEGTEPFKLSKQAILDDYGKPLLDALPRPYVYSAEGGVHPDVAAEALGFKSGNDLLKSLITSEKYQNHVARVTNERMQSEHGERLSELQVREIAAQAVRNEKQSQVLRREAEILASDHYATFKGLVRKITGVIPPTAVTKALAEKTVGNKSVRELRPDLYQSAARRQAIAAREALLKGDVQGAFDAKNKEILATEIYRAALDAKNSVAEALVEFRKVYQSDTKLAKTHDMSLVNAARSILSAFEIGSSREKPDTYMKQLREYDPETAETVEAMVNEQTGNAQNYKDMPYQDFQSLRETVKGLWVQARQSMQITVDGQKMDRLAVRDELIARADELRQPGELMGYKKAVTGWEQAKIGLLAFKAVSRRIEHWVRGFDGGDSQGVMRRYVWNRVSEAATAFRIDKHAAVSEYAEFLTGLKDDMPITRAKIPAPELDYTFAGHNELLGALLHRGNDSNFAKLLVGRGWGSMLEDGTLDTSKWDAFEKRLRTEGTLTKAHYDYVQGVWDRFEGLKPGAQRAHKEQFGRYFAEITTKEFSNEFGTYKGGYYPAKVDPYMVTDAQAKADRDALLGSNTSFMYPSVGKGFTKSRVENYRKPLLLDASAVPQHFDAVLRFTHLGPAIRDVARIVMDPVFQESVNALDPTIVHDALVPWLKRAGQQRGESQGDSGRFWATANKVASKVRNNAALQIMAFNSTVLLEQLTHFPSVFVRVDKGKMANAVWKYATDHRAMTAAINDRSPFMATRETAALTEARKQIDRILLDPTVFTKVEDFAQAHGRFLMAGVQSIMDHVTWHAVYDQSMERGLTEIESAREADSQVRELLGSYTPEDVSKIEAGTPIQRLFTMFYGFFNTKGNVLATEQTIAQQVGLKKGSGRATGALFWGFMVPAVMGSVIKTVMGTKPFVEDDEGSLHAILRHFGLAQLEMAGRMVPFASNAIALGEKAFGKGTGGSLLDSPAIKTLGDAITGSVRTLRDAADDTKEVTSKDITDFFTLIGLVSGLPIKPLAKPIGYMHDVHTGKTTPTSNADRFRGLLTGR